MKKEKYSYRSLQERLRQEYKLYLLAFVFIVIADGKVMARGKKEEVLPELLREDCQYCVGGKGRRVVQ